MRPSTVDRLPEPVRERVWELRRAGRTIDEILDALRALDAPVSRSALARHTKRIDAIGEQIRQSRQVAEALVERYGSAPEDRMARLNVELMHGVVNRLLVAEDGGPVDLAPNEVSALTAALRNLTLTARHDIEREKALRAQFAAKAVEAAKAKGVGADAVEAIRAVLEPAA